MNRAVFLDRDGVINEIIYHQDIGIIDTPFTVEQFKFLPKAEESIKRINDMGLKVVVITNQPGVAKNQLTRKTIEDIHQKMVDGLFEYGAKIDEIYECLHHPVGKEDGDQSLIKKCDCRKPEPGLIFEAAEELDIDLKNSFMVGDSIADIQAGQKVGMFSILVGNLKLDLWKFLKEHNVEPDVIVPDLKSAVDLIEEKLKL